MSAREVTGADGKTITVPESEWYINTKARARRMMENSLSSEARRVYACLELATMGFSQELAVIMTKKGIRPLTRSDIAQQTGFSEPHVRRGLVELEGEGLADRRGADDGPLHKGKVEIYSWAFPRATDKKKGSHRAAPIPDWFPKSWEPLKPLISRLKLTLAPELEPARGSLFDEGEEIARKYQKAEKEAIALLKGVCARRPYKEERNGKEPERNIEAVAPAPVPPVAPRVSSSSALSVQERPTEPRSLLSPGDDDEKPKPAQEYADGREHLKAVYRAKTGEFAPCDFLDRIETILVAGAHTFEQLIEVLQPHLGNHWKNPGGFITDRARHGFGPATGPPQLKPKPKCPRCMADNQRGAVLEGGKIVACPDCSTEAWRAELAGKEQRRAKGVGV